MAIIKKTLKTYGSEGKRKYQQIKINKSDNLEDGTVYVLTEDKYKELAQYQTELKTVHQQVTILKEDNDNLTEELKDLQNRVSKLQEEKTEYKILSEKQTHQLAKLEERNNTLVEKIEKGISETTKVNVQLETTKDRLETLTTMVTKKDDTINDLKTELHEEEKAKLSMLYSIHNRLMSLSLWDMIRGKHKPILKEIAPVGEIKEVETTTNNPSDIG